MSKPRSTSIVAAVATLAFAGCIGPEGQIEAQSINLAYDGAQSGNHESAGACDSEGTLTGRGTITDGNVRVQVLDGSGNTRFDRTYDSDFTLESQVVTGASGTWKIMGERDGDDLIGDQFQGSYTITTRC